MDEDTQKILISMMEQLNKLEENMKTIESNVYKPEEVYKKDIKTDNVIYNEPKKENKSEPNQEEQVNNNEYSDDFVERVENLIIAVDGILEYVQDNMDNSGIKMPVGIIRMLLDLVLNYAPNIVTAVPFKPKDICNIGAKQKTKGGKQKRNMGCSAADLLSNFI